MGAIDEINAFELCSLVLTAADGDARPLIELAGEGETDWLEFKSACGPPVGQDCEEGCNADDYRWHVVLAIIALANTNGGCVLLGVDDKRNAVGLAACDRKNVLGREGWDAFLRHLDATVFRPASGWKCKEAGKIVLEDAPHDLVDMRRATLDGQDALAILVRPRPAGERCVHYIKDPGPEEQDRVPVRDLGYGRVRKLTRASQVGPWERDRRPAQSQYAVLLEKFNRQQELAASVSELGGLEERIGGYHAGLERTLAELDRCFVSLDAEERHAVEIHDDAFQPWAEEYLSDDFPMDEGNENGPDLENDGDENGPDTGRQDDGRAARHGGVFDLLALEPRAILIGEPGGGKTTCLQRLALRTRKAYLPGGPVAVFLPLSRYCGAGDLMPLIVRSASFDKTAGFTEADLDHFMRSDRLLLLIDALNECPEKHRPACVAEISQLLRRYPRLPVTLSARSVGWQNEFRLPVFVLQPLSAERQEELLAKYLDHPEKGRAIHRQVLALPGGAGAADNPFFLRMAVQVFREDDDLPASRALLYRRFVGIWYAREAKKARNAGTPLPWNEALTRRALAHLAFTARLEGGRVVPVARALEILTGEIEVPDKFLDRLGQGFLLRCADGQVDVVHETFQEYLAAEHCLTEPAALDRLQRADYPQWGMVLAYAADLARQPSPSLLAAAWCMNPWLAAALAPLGSPQPDWAAVTAGWDPLPVKVLKQFFVGAAITESMVLPSIIGRYSRNDAALVYTIENFPAAKASWQTMEADMLRLVWHPAGAVSFFKRCLSAVDVLMAKAWPPKLGQNGARPWHFPRSWVTKATGAHAKQLIALGVLTAADFSRRKPELLFVTQPFQIRYWIEAGVLEPNDFAGRKGLLNTANLAQICELVVAGLRNLDDFGLTKPEIVAKATAREAPMLVNAGICVPQDFASRKTEWLANAYPKEVKELISAGICAAGEFSFRKAQILATTKIKVLLKWIGAGVCSAEEYKHGHVLAAHATVNEALRLVTAGICRPEDFASRQQALARTVKDSQQQRLIACGICDAEDFAAQAGSEAQLWPALIRSLVRFAQGQLLELANLRALLPPGSPLKNWQPSADLANDLSLAMSTVRSISVPGLATARPRGTTFAEVFSRPDPPWQELRRIATLYLIARGIDLDIGAKAAGPSQASDLPEPSQYYSGDLTDETRRAAIKLQLKHQGFEMIVIKVFPFYCFLKHPKFADSVFCSRGNLPVLDVGDSVLCRVNISTYVSRNAQGESAKWGFFARKARLAAAHSPATNERRSDTSDGDDRTENLPGEF